LAVPVRFGFCQYFLTILNRADALNDGYQKLAVDDFDAMPFFPVQEQAEWPVILPVKKNISR